MAVRRDVLPQKNATRVEIGLLRPSHKQMAAGRLPDQSGDHDA
jgi:hypothetical protein